MLDTKEILYPELRNFAPDERAHALADARATPFDALELFGMAAGLVAVTALTRHLFADAAGEQRFFALVMNFLVAMPLLALCLGPFHVRRIRRGLRSALTRHPRPSLAPR